MIRLLKKQIFVMVLIVAALCLVGCTGQFSIVKRIDSYGYYISNLVQYEDKSKNDGDNDSDNDNDNDDDDDSKIDLKLEIDGFDMLFDDAYDFATPFYGDYAFVLLNNKMYAIDKNGNKTEVSEPIDETLQNDKFIFKTDEGLGVKTIFGQEIVKPQYSHIKMINNTILAKDDNNRFSCFVGSELKFTDAEGEYTLVHEQYILTPFGLIDLEQKPVYFSNYRAFDIVGDVFIISDLGLFGCAKDGQVIIEPKYFAVSYYNNGYAVVADNEGYKLIDEHGATLFFDKDIIPISYDGLHLIYKKGNRYGIMDSDFQALTDAIFVSVVGDCVIEGEYIIERGDYDRIFSLSHKDYMGVDYNSLTYYNGFFVGEGQAQYTLFDKYYDVVIEDFEYIEYSQSILLVKTEHGFCYYIPSIS